MIAQLHVLTNYSCTMHCKMCGLPPYADPKNRWTPRELSKAIKGLEKDMRIIVSGGECTLREDLPEICQILFKLNPKELCICSNGYLPKRLEELIDSFTPEQKFKVSISLSVDGFKKTHDIIRRQGSFENVIKSLKLLRKGGIKVGVFMCIQPLNYKEIYDVFLLSQELDACDFSATIAQPYDFYEWPENMIKDITAQLHKIVNTIKPISTEKKTIRWCLLNLVPHLQTRKRIVPCIAGETWVVLDPFGDVYPCFNAPWDAKGEYGNYKFSFGNIKRDGTLLEIHGSERADKARKAFGANKCNICWGCDIWAYKGL